MFKIWIISIDAIYMFHIPIINVKWVKKKRGTLQHSHTMAELINPNPKIYQVSEDIKKDLHRENEDNDVADEIDALEVFDLIRKINDPEHPLTLEQLNVAQHENITVDDKNSSIHINFTPTVPHCSMATLIGLCIRVKLLRSLPQRFKVDINVAPGSHASEDAVNKQLNDKERVAAALENAQLVDVVNNCIINSEWIQASLRWRRRDVQPQIKCGY